MVVVSFSIEKLLYRILIGEKHQTFRILETGETGEAAKKWNAVLRKFQAREQVILNLYWKQRSPKEGLRIGDVPLTDIREFDMHLLSKEDATRDGMDSLGELLEQTGPSKQISKRQKVWKRRNLWQGIDYFYDAEAIKGSFADERMGNPGNYENEYSKGAGRGDAETKGKAWLKGQLGISTGRNKRDVWWVGTRPYKDAHFATFPPELIEPCIKAGTSEKGVCPQCGAPWIRIVERKRVATRPGTHTKVTGTSSEQSGNRDPERHCTDTQTVGWEPGCDCQPDSKKIEKWKRACGADKHGEYHGTATKDYESANAQDPSAVKARILAGMGTKQTVGWGGSCDHDLKPIPAIILDPFGGAGTTTLVALKLGRDFVIIELNPEYVTLIKKRIHGLRTTRITPFLKPCQGDVKS